MASGGRYLVRAAVLGAAVVLAVAVPACSGGSRSGGASTSTVEHRRVVVAGATRGYRLFTPANRGGALPLVLALHGGGDTADSLVQATQLDKKAAIDGFLVAYPQADQVWNGGFCCTGGRGSMSGDIRFLDRVVTDVAAVRRVDVRRVYALGVSAGGVMAYRLGCDQAGRFAGIGSVAGTMQVDDCHPARPISVIEIHGTSDGLVPYEGGPVISPRVATAPSPSVMAVARRWASLDRCRASPATRTAGTVTTADWTGCAGGSRVRLVTLAGGGHTWYATEFGIPDGAVDATTTLLTFFGLEGIR